MQKPWSICACEREEKNLGGEKAFELALDQTHENSMHEY
jgi:hypothetical protein